MSHGHTSGAPKSFGLSAERKTQTAQAGGDRTDPIEIRLQRQFAAICELTAKIDTASADPSPSLRLAVETAADVLAVESVSIWMPTSARTELECFDRYIRADYRHVLAAPLPFTAFPPLNPAAGAAQRVYTPAAARPAGSSTTSGEPALQTSVRLDVPIRLRGETVGFLSFEDAGNGRKWEVDELNFAVVIADIASRTIESSEARRGEEELVYRLKFEELLTSLSMLFINLSAESVDEGINHALGEIGRFSGVDRCYVLYSSDNMLTVSNNHEWCAAGIPSLKTLLQAVTPANYPWLFKQLTEFDSIKIDRIGDLPPDAQAEHGHFEQSGVRSLIMIPLVTSGRRVGCLGLDTVRRERTWEEGDISFLRIVGEMFVNALERKRGEIQLMEQQQFFRKVIDLNPNFIFAKDRDCKFTLVNQAVADAYGTTVDALVGKSDADFNSDKQQVEWFRQADLEVMNSNTSVFIPEEPITDATGKMRWLQTVKIPIQGADGAVTHMLGVATDVTERKRYEEEQRRLEAQIQHTQKLESLGVLAGGIAHDFNNLLMGVLGNAGLALMDVPADSKVKNRIEQIKIAAKRASELTNQLLAYSGKGKFVVGPLDLNQIVGEMTALLETIISKKASFRLNLSSNVEAIEADATQLRQVVMNLITNASDALAESSGTITVATGMKQITAKDADNYLLKDGLQDGNYTYLEISDTGCGMDQDSLQRIFDPFYTTKFTGRGLGLAAVMGIVRSHRGTLSVESTVGSGTTFRIYFPTAGSAPINATTEAKPILQHQSTSGLFLVVDDEETTRAVAAEMLGHFGYEVIVANDGRDGVTKFRKYADRLVGVLLDMTMPILDGEDALKEMVLIRQDVPFILSSGYCEQDITERYRDKCAVCFLQKPYGPSALERSINEVRSQAARL